MAIKISGSTIIDDSRVIVNADKIGIGTPSPTRELSILSSSPNPTGIGVSAVNSQGTSTNKAISVFNAGITSTFSVSYTGSVTALEYFGTFKGDIDTTAAITNANKIKINHNSDDDFFNVPFFSAGLSNGNYGDIQYDAANSLEYNPSLGNLRITSGAGNTGLILKTTNNFDNRAISFQNSANSYVGAIGFVDRGNNQADLFFLTGGTSADINSISETMRLTKESTVGIGTTAPAAKLDIFKSYSGLGIGHTAVKIYGIDSGVGETGILFLEKGTNLHTQPNAYLMRGISDGATQFVFGANGRVGIGTSLPDVPLHILSSVDTLGILSSTDSGANLDIYDDTTQSRIRTVDGRLHIEADKKDAEDDSEIRFFIDNNRKMGITSEAHLYFSSDTDTYIHHPAANNFAFVTNDEERFRIKGGGNIGIGTDDPDSKLHVMKAGAGTVTSDGNAVITLENNNHSVLQILSPADRSGRIMFGDPDDTNAGQISYDHNIDILSVEVNGGEKARITGFGSFGLGTTDPDGKLHISSGAGANGDCIVIIEADEDNAVESSNPQLWFKQDGDIKASVVGQDSNKLVICNNISGGGGIIFRTGTTDNRGTDDPFTGATEKLRITSGGDVGIGTNNPTGTNALTNNTTTLAVGILTATQIFGPVKGALEPTGDVSIPGNLTVTGDINANGNIVGDSATNISGMNQITATTFVGNGDFVDLDVDGHTELDDLNVSGFSTFVKNAEFKGNVSIAGTLTYEDVTNVDSIGFITARNGIHVIGAGVSVAGISTFIDNVEFKSSVGIGTDNPLKPLHITAADCRIRLEDAGITTDVELQNNSGDAVLTTNGASNVRLQTDNTERLRINSDGDVGIGTNNPTGTNALTNNNTTLAVGIVTASEVYGTIKGSIDPDVAVDKANSIKITEDEGQSGTNYIFFGDNSTEGEYDGVRIDKDALVYKNAKFGIGTNNPDTPLHIYANDAQQITVERASANNSGIRFRNTVSSMFAGLTSNATGFAIDDDDNLSSGPMFFVERSTGKVGINNLLPAYRFHVKDDTGTARDASGNERPVGFAVTIARFTNMRIPSGGNALHLSIYDKRINDRYTNTWAGSERRIEYNVDDNSNKRMWIGFLNETDGTSDNIIRFGEKADIEWMRIDNGKVGIGTTIPTQALHISGEGAGQNTLRIDTSGTAIAINNHAQNSMGFIGNDSGALFINAGGENEVGSDTLSLRTNGTEKLRITKEGNVGIGTTNPLSPVESSNTSVLAVGILTATTIFGNVIGGISDTGNVDIDGNLTVTGNTTLGNGDEDLTTINGNLKIEDANPVFTFIDSTNNSDFRIEVQSGQFRIQDHTNSNVNRLHINSSGNIGIGTSGFDGTGNVGIGTFPHSEIRLTSVRDGLNKIIQRWGGYQGSTAGHRFIDLHSPEIDSKNDYFKFKTGNAIKFEIDTKDALCVDSNGDVGIGTDDVQAQLHLKGSDPTLRIQRYNQSAYGDITADTAGKITFKSDPGGAASGDGFAFTVDNSEKLSISSTGITSIKGSDDQDNFIVDVNGTNFAVHTDASDGEISLRAQDGTASNNSKFMTFFTQASGQSTTERLRITTDGTVQFKGDVNPQAEFDRGSANNTNINLKYNGTFTGQISAANADFQLSAVGASTPMSFYTNGSEKLSINVDGDLLRGGAGQDIGASGAPWDKIYANEFIGEINTTQTNLETGNLLVTGIATFQGNVSIAGTLTYEDVTNVDSIGFITARNGIHVIGAGVSVAGISTFINNVEFQDSIGVGTPTPSNNLHVVGTSKIEGAATFNNDVTISKEGNPILTVETAELSGRDALIKIRGARTTCNTCDIAMLEFDNKTNSAYTMAQISAMDPSGQHANKRGKLVFRTATGGTLSDQMTIREDGDVGIGTVSPESILHIHSGTPRITMSDSGTGAHHRINADSSVGNFAFDVDYDSVTSTPAFIVNIKGGEKFRINSDGDLLRGGTGQDIGASNARWDVGYFSRIDATNITGTLTAGSDKQVIFNNDGVLTGNDKLAFDLHPTSGIGSLGIGYNNPAATLSVHSATINVESEAIRLGRIASNNPDLRFHSIITNHSGADSKNYIQFNVHDGGDEPYTSQAEVLNLLGNGKVGIGSTIPQALLDVNGTGTLAKFGSTVTGAYEALYIKNNVAGYPAITNESSDDTIELRSAGSVQATIDYNNNKTDKYFRVMANNQSGDGTELFRVQEDGDVGIGTNNPTGTNALTNNNTTLAVGILTANQIFGPVTGDLNTTGNVDIDGNLEVNGTSTFTNDVSLTRGTATNTLTRTLTIGGARQVSGNHFAVIDFKNYDANDAAVDYVAAKITGTPAVDSDNGGELAFYTSPTGSGVQTPVERLRIDENGDVGINSAKPQRTVGPTLDVRGDIIFNGNAIISSYLSPDANPNSPSDYTNVDHFWHDDSTFRGFNGSDSISNIAYGIWSFVSDGSRKTYAEDKGSAIKAGYFVSSRGGSFMGDVGIGTTNPRGTNAVDTSNTATLAVGILTARQIFGPVTGSITPDGDVDINGDLTVTTSSFSPIKIERTSANNTVIHYKNSTSGSDMYAGIAGNALGWAIGIGGDLGNITNNKFMVRREGSNAGNIGIGVLDPNRLLHLESNGNSYIRLTDSDTTAETDSAVGVIEFETRDTNNAGVSALIGAYHENNQGRAYLRFDTGKSTTVTERLRITSDGDVGIGTIDPTGTNALTNNNTTLAVGIVTANEVYGTIKGSIDPSISVSNATNVNITDSGAGNHYIHFGSAKSGFDGVEVDSPRLVYNDGQVAIGTETPESRLTIFERVANTHGVVTLLTLVSDKNDMLHPQTPSNTSGGAIKFINSDDNNTDGQALIQVNTPDSYTGFTNESGERESTVDFNFKQTNKGVLNTTLTIKGETGDVGIGTINPVGTDALTNNNTTLAVGIVTANNGFFTDVKVSGTLTYEDVTNIDSVGIITAQNGIHVTTNGIDAVGVITATSFEGNLNASDLSTGTVNTARLPTTITHAAKITIKATGATHDVHLDAADNIIFESGEEEDGAIYFRGNSGSDSYRFSKGGQTAIEGFLSFESLTSDRTFTFPDAGGTIALTSGNISGNADTATKLANARDFSISGEITAAAVSFDGSANVTLDATVDNNVIDEANLKISNAPVNGYVLTAQSGNTGGLTWAAPSSVGNNTTYSISCVNGVNSDEERIRLTDSDGNTDDVTLEAGTGLSIARSGDKITFTNTDTGSGTGDTTYAISCVNGVNSDEERIRLTDSDGNTDDVTLEAGTGLSISRSGDKITFTNTDTGSGTNTTYAISCVNGVNSDEERIRLTDSDGNTDDVTLEAGTGLSIARSGDKITFTNTDTGSGTNTTYDLLVPSGTTKIRLDPSEGSNDDIEIAGGSNVTVTRNNANKLTIAAVAGAGFDIEVDQTDRSCGDILTVTEPSTGTKRINIPDSSNAYGAKYVQSTTPSGSFCDGDIWYDTSGINGISTTSTSTNTTLVIGDVGKLKLATGTGDQFTVPASVFSPGDYVSFHNHTAAIIDIVTATNVTIYLSGSNISVSSGGEVKLSPRALATLTCIVGGASPQFVISGGGVYI